MEAITYTFILLDKKTGGVYAVNDDNGGKVVQIFVDKDDADRYYSLLQADDYKRPSMLLR